MVWGDPFWGDHLWHDRTITHVIWSCVTRVFGFVSDQNIFKDILICTISILNFMDYGINFCALVGRKFCGSIYSWEVIFVDTLQLELSPIINARLVHYIQ